MELIKNFGIDPILLGAQIINFLVIFYFLRRFLYKPILGVLKKREEVIKEGIKKSEEANSRLEKIVKDEKTIFTNAQMQAKQIVQDARDTMIKEASKTEENAKKEAEKILNDARKQITFEAKKVEKRLTLSISNLALKFLEKSIQGVFSEKEQEEILKRTVKKLKIK